MISFERARGRIIQEYVPGKQVTLAHVLRNPVRGLCQSIGVDGAGALGVLTITPGEGSIIAADVASKAASVKVEFVDRFTGCVLISGDVSSVEVALRAVLSFMRDVLGFYVSEVTVS